MKKPVSSKPAPRVSVRKRKTRETDITCNLVLDGSGNAKVSTGIPFFDHMLEALTRHSLFDLELTAKGDLEVDYHHTMEDVGIVLGEALNEALADRKGIRRYGFSLLPMDESLSQVAIDLGGRPYFVYSINNKTRRIRDFDTGLFEEFWRAFATAGRMNLHIAHLYGKDIHHAHESVFKAVAKSLDMAVTVDPRVTGVPSSKGSL